MPTATKPSPPIRPKLSSHFSLTIAAKGFRERHPPSREARDTRSGPRKKARSARFQKRLSAPSVRSVASFSRSPSHEDVHLGCNVFAGGSRRGGRGGCTAHHVPRL